MKPPKEKLQDVEIAATGIPILHQRRKFKPEVSEEMVWSTGSVVFIRHFWGLILQPELHAKKTVSNYMPSDPARKRS
jgi:hypothetical protein